MTSAGFEDTVFLLNIRIRMVRDTMRLNPPSAPFMDKCMDDIAFIDEVLASLARKISAAEESGEAQAGANSMLDYASDTEWQFSQLLTEFLLKSNSFSAQASPESREKVVALREDSNARRKIFEKFGMSAQNDLAEPLVSPTELSILFGGT